MNPASLFCIAFHLLFLQTLCFLLLGSRHLQSLLSRFLGSSCFDATTWDYVPSSTSLLADLRLLISMPCLVQAFLHFENFSALVFLSVLAFLPGLHLATSGPSSTARIGIRCRLVVFLLAVATILIEDYRLTPNGLIFSLIGIGADGLIQILPRVSTSFTAIAANESLSRTISFATIAISLFLALMTEDTTAALLSFWQLAPYVWATTLVSVLSLSMALSSGAGIIVYSLADTRYRESTTSLNSLFRLLPWITMTGILEAYLSASFHAFISPFQVLGFMIAVICVVDFDLSSIRQINPSHCSFPPSVFYRPRSGFSAPSLFQDEEDAQEADFVSLKTESSPEVGSILDVLMILSTLVCWLFIIWSSVHGSDTWDLHPHRPSLDLTYTPSSTFDVVISMYKESLDEVLRTVQLVNSVPAITSRSPRFLFYVKDAEADLDRIQTAIPSVNITILPNRGREGETYLYHIVSQWDNLANHTMFLQAETHNPRELLPRIRDYYGADTGMLSLSFVGNTCDCRSKTCGDRFWSDESGIVRSIHERANNITCSPDENNEYNQILLSYKGQFIASAARIRGIDRGIYEELRNLLIDESSRVHQEPYLQGRKDKMSAPVFGYTVERLWSSLMQCSDSRVAKLCPSLLSGFRTGGKRSDCQCFD